MIEQIGVVVIGRNEGDRLTRCLSSTLGSGPVVYVDSGSTDGSVENARSAGAVVLQLDRSVAFTAARARNAGFRRLLEGAPAVRFVQFVDGDCEIDAGWPAQGRATLENDPSIAIVCGGLRERSPEASIYNRLGDMEWRKPLGDVEHCGGVFMIRAEVFERVGGFDATIAAGEEPELCCRVRQAGFRVVRLDRPMATHDLNMTRFSQWWRRSFRGGYGALRLTLFGPVISRHVFRSQVRSAICWGIGLPITVMAGVCAASATGGWPWSLTLLAIWPVLLAAQSLRLAWKASRRGCPASAALAHGVLTVLWKYAAVAGFVTCLLDQRREHRSAEMVTREFHKSVV